MKPQNDVIGLVQELIQRGWRVTNAHDHTDKVSVAFELMSGADPTWHKAVEVPAELANPNEVERAMRAWQAKVRLDLKLGRPSPVVRRMIAEHGQDAVDRALSAPLGVLAASRTAK